MGDAVDLDPFVGVELAVADDLAHLGVEDLGAAARQRPEARGHEARQHLLDRQLLDLREPADLDRRECLQVRLRKARLETAQHLLVPGHVEVGVEAADDVELGDVVAPLLGGLAVDLVVRHRPGVGFVLERREAAELAVVGVDADVRRIDVPVDVVIADVAVELPADEVRQPSEMQDVRRREAERGVDRIEAFAGEDFFGDRPQFRRKGGRFEGLRHAANRSIGRQFLPRVQAPVRRAGLQLAATGWSSSSPGCRRSRSDRRRRSPPALPIPGRPHCS